MFEDFSFAILRIIECPSRLAAEESGYKVDLHDDNVKDGLQIPEDLGDTNWDIPKSKHGANSPENTEFNKREYQKLLNNFPSLRCTIYWPQKVIPPTDPGEKARYDRLRNGKSELSWVTRRLIFLHKLILTMLVSLWHAADATDVLLLTPYALRVIRILAVGLRGMLLRLNHKQVSPIEESASAGPTFRKVAADDNNLTSIMVGDDAEPTKKGRAGPRTVTTTFTNTSSILWVDYLVEVEKRQRETSTISMRTTETVSAHVGLQLSNLDAENSNPVPSPSVAVVKPKGFAFGGV